MKIDSLRCPACRAGFSPTAKKCLICGGKLIATSELEPGDAGTATSAIGTIEPGTIPDLAHAPDSSFSEPPTRGNRVMLRQAPAGWAKDLAEALQIAGVEFVLEAPLDAPQSIYGQTSPLDEHQYAIYVPRDQYDAAFAVDEEIYAKQVPGGGASEDKDSRFTGDPRVWGPILQFGLLAFVYVLAQLLGC